MLIYKSPNCHLWLDVFRLKYSFDPQSRHMLLIQLIGKYIWLPVCMSITHQRDGPKTNPTYQLNVKKNVIWKGKNANFRRSQKYFPCKITHSEWHMCRMILKEQSVAINIMYQRDQIPDFYERVEFGFTHTKRAIVWLKVPCTAPDMPHRKNAPRTDRLLLIQ